MPASSITFLESLRPLHLLDAARLDELARDPATAGLPPQALVPELLRRGWLTPYQAERLLQGRGRELLLGAYVLLGLLGEGGMGAVFHARAWKLGRDVALKVVRKDRLTNPAVLERFRREIRAAGQLSHPNVVHAFDAGEDGGVFYFAMELMTGADLQRVVTERGPLPVEQACDTLRQAALGLQHAHEHGLVHRDVKPSNLLLTAPGEIVKVLDLGLALLCRRSETSEDSSTLTQHGTLMGSLDYIAPEQARDSHTVDHRADLYSLGCTFYFLLTGQPPFPLGPMAAKVGAHLFEEPEPVEKMRPETPPAVAAVVRKLMAKNPDDRYQTAAEVAAVLAALPHPSADGDATIPATDAPPSAAALPAPAPIRAPQGRRLLVVTAVAVVLLAGLAGVLALALPRRPTPTPSPAAPPAPADAGELTLVSTDPAIRVLVHSKADPNKGGVLRPNAPVPVAAGDYELELSGDALAGLRLSQTAVTLAPGGRQTVRVEGAPLSSWALVSRPAWIDGVQSWTLATRTGRGAVQRLAYSPDGRSLAFANEDGVVRVVDAVQARETGPHPPPTLRALVGHTSTVRAIAWSPDGKTLATASWDKTVRIWDVASGRSERPLPFEAAALAWSPDDKLLACAVGNAVLLWDVAANQPETSLPNGGGGARALAWSAEPGALAAAGDSGAVVLWRRAEGEWAKVVRTGHTQGVTSLAWSPDGKTLASGSGDGTLRLWGADGPAFQVIPTGKVSPRMLAWSPDGKTVAAAGGGDDTSVRLWDAETGQAGSVFPGHSYGVADLSWSLDGTLASGGQDRLVRFWDPQMGKALGTLGGHADVATSLVWSPDGSKLATGSQSASLYLWDASSGRGLRTHAGPGGWSYAKSWSADGRSLFAIGNWQNRVRRWEVESDRAQDLGMPDVTIWGAALSPDANTLTVWHADGSIQLMDPDGNGVRATLPGRKALVTAPAWSPDGALIAAAYDGGWVSLWDPLKVVPVQERQQKGRIGGLAWSPDGKTLALGGDGVIRLWDRSLSDPPTLLQVKESNEPIHAAAWEWPPGKGLYSIGEDGVLRLWDVESGKVQRTSHPGTTSGVFSPDATRLASAGVPWTLRLWEAATGRPMGTVVRLNQGWVVFSEDGHYRCENQKVEDELVYVVQTEPGQETLTPQEFAAKYGWKNDPEKARLDSRAQ